MTVKMNPVELDKASIVLKLLGDKTRLSMMKMLENNECCVCEFVELFSISQSAISQHLRKLRDVGLVKENRKGQWIFYSINKENEAYELIKQVLAFIPDQEEQIRGLEKKGLRIICN